MTIKLNGPEIDLVTLAANLAAAKKEEGRARDARLEAERELIAALDFKLAEGQMTFEQENDKGEATVVLKQPITTKIDDAEWEKIRRTLDNNHPARKVFLRTYKLDTRAARAIQEDQPALWAEVAPAITRKPGKVSVDVKNISLLS